MSSGTSAKLNLLIIFTRASMYLLTRTICSLRLHPLTSLTLFNTTPLRPCQMTNIFLILLRYRPITLLTELLNLKLRLFRPTLKEKGVTQDSRISATYVRRQRPPSTHSFPLLQPSASIFQTKQLHPRDPRLQHHTVIGHTPEPLVVQ